MTEEEYFNYLVTQMYIAINNADDFNKRELCIMKLHFLTNLHTIFKDKENYENVIKVLNKEKQKRKIYEPNHL